MQCVSDPCLFVCFKRMLFVGIHTDDSLMVGPAPVRRWFKEKFAERFPTKDLGFPRMWCGTPGRWLNRSFDGDLHQEAVGEVLARQN